jgi:hypothetical protein
VTHDVVSSSFYMEMRSIRRALSEGEGEVGIIYSKKEGRLPRKGYPSLPPGRSLRSSPSLNPADSGIRIGGPPGKTRPRRTSLRTSFCMQPRTGRLEINPNEETLGIWWMDLITVPMKIRKFIAVTNSRIIDDMVPKAGLEYGWH